MPSHPRRESKVVFVGALVVSLITAIAMTGPTLQGDNFSLVVLVLALSLASICLFMLLARREE